jgi:hypothetical protein
MKKFLGFACAIAIACVAIGCGDKSESAKSDSAKSGSTAQTDSKGPKANADSEGQQGKNAPDQNPEPDP